LSEGPGKKIRPFDTPWGKIAGKEKQTTDSTVLKKEKGDLNLAGLRPLPKKGGKKRGGGLAAPWRGGKKGRKWVHLGEPDPPELLPPVREEKGMRLRQGDPYALEREKKGWYVGIVRPGAHVFLRSLEEGGRKGPSSSYEF